VVVVVFGVFACVLGDSFYVMLDFVVLVLLLGFVVLVWLVGGLFVVGFGVCIGFWFHLFVWVVS